MPIRLPLSSSFLAGGFGGRDGDATSSFRRRVVNDGISRGRPEPPIQDVARESGVAPPYHRRHQA